MTDTKTLPIVTIDFETRWGKGLGFATQTTTEYVNDPRFHVHMMGLKINDGKTSILYDHHINDALRWIDTNLGPVQLVAQNTIFDGYILSQLYRWVPAVYRDTMAMSRGLWPHASASLKDLCTRIWPEDATKRKGTDLPISANVEILSHEQRKIIANYCTGDVELTYGAYVEMVKVFPPEELEIIDLLVRCFTQSRFQLDRPLMARYVDFLSDRQRKIIEASGHPKDVYTSSLKFAALLRDLGVEVPMKTSPSDETKQIPAFSKKDTAYLATVRNHPELQHIWDAKTNARSAGDASRAKRLLSIAASTRGTLPIPIRYSAAHTHRLGGCLVAETIIIAYNDIRGCHEKTIQEVLPDDLIWDGEEFVAHEGLINQGEREVISYDSITGTPCHPVFTDEISETISLREASERGYTLKTGARPSAFKIDTARTTFKRR